MAERFGMGWLRDWPDYRDLTSEYDRVPARASRLGQKESVKAMLTKVGVAEPTRSLSPTSPALKPWFSPIEDQGSLGSCTANAGVGLVEYFERRAFGRHIDASRLFLYKVTRNMLHWTGDTGAFLRTTMGGLVLFGVPPEEYWPYQISEYDKEPSSFCYAFAQAYQALTYYRLDPPQTPSDVLLNRLKLYLAAGLPSMFGFTVYSSISQASSTGKIPFPTPGEQIVGGHAIIAAGYDDNMKIKNSNDGGAETTGAFLIRNSWGAGWGDGGYGWLPYEYVRRGLAVDWWSLLRNEWIDTGVFKLQ